MQVPRTATPPAALALGATLLLGSSLTAVSAQSSQYAYRGSAGSPESLSVTGAPGWVARSVEAELQPLGGSAGSAGLVMHHQDDQNHYLFLYSTNSTALMIYRKLAGSYTLLGQVPFSVPFGEEHTLGGLDDGAGNLSITWDGAVQLTVQDASFSTGRAGVRVWNMTADFDDVVVRDGGGTELFADDFESGAATAWNPGPGWSVVSEGGGGLVMPTPVFDTAFDGGNVEVLLVDPVNWTVRIQPELKGSSPYRAWFYFEMSNLSGAQPTRIEVQSASFFTGPWYSYDRVTWQPLPAAGGAWATSFTQDPVWIAHSIPYLPSHEQELASDTAGPLASWSTLSTSEGGRPIDVARVTAPGDPSGRRQVWLLGRQHAWEASGSWVADGLVRWLVSSDPSAALLRREAVVRVVPITDEDNVVLGGSGKDQQPIDINRDWREGPFWNVVRDAIAAIDQVAAGADYDLFIDSHCPGSATTFLAVQPQSMVPASYWQEFNTFRQYLITATAGSALPYTGTTNQWGPSYHPLWYQMSFWHQYTSHPELRLSLTLETQVASNAGYADLGAGLGRAIEGLLDCPEPPGGIASYCTAGVSASGCRATLAACGTASASAPSGFDLVARRVEGAKDGLFFFGSSGRQANPWGNGTSYQCVAPPVVRTGLLTGSGTAGACDGGFWIDLNALWCPSCPAPAKNPGAGATVQTQLWYRDPQSSSNQTTGLSDALELLVSP